MRSNTLTILHLLVAIPSVAGADIINFPTNWGNLTYDCTFDGSFCRAEALPGSPTIGIDIPHDVAVQLIARPGWGVRIARTSLGSGAGPTPYSKSATVQGALVDVYGKNAPMYANANLYRGEDEPTELCLWAGKQDSQGSWDGKIQWKGPCVTTTWKAIMTSCSVKGPDVLLDHGVINQAEGNVATATATIHCNGNASGHLALPDGGDTIRFAQGYSKLTTDIGPISTTRPFAKGNTPIELKSTLHDVEPGTRTSSAAIIVVLD